MQPEENKDTTGHSRISLDGLIESLYGLDRWELRRLAFEALLISDGPDSPFKADSPYGSEEAVLVRKSLDETAFVIWLAGQKEPKKHEETDHISISDVARCSVCTPC